MTGDGSVQVPPAGSVRLQVENPRRSVPKNRFRTVEPAQIGYWGWLADYVSPSTFISSPFACAGLSASGSGAPNISRLCDRQPERQIDAALAAQGAQAAAAWAAADRRVVDLAAVVPHVNSRAVVFISKRVGNFQQHLQWFTLLDQLWVR